MAAPGDLYLIVHVSPSPVFTRKGDNFEVEVPLSIPEALRGAEVQVPTLDGTKTLRVAPGTKHGTVQRLRGEGPPKPGSVKSGSAPARGDIRYRFVIDVPDKLDEEQQAAVDALSKVFNDDPVPRSNGRRPGAELMMGPGVPRSGVRRPSPPSTRVEVATDRGVFMISVAAKLANMHPQTLRMYESRGLIAPQRSPKGTRLYSHEDVEKLRRIQEMTADLGLNLAGVERVLDLEEEIELMHARIQEIELQALQAQVRLAEELEEVRRSLRAELVVPYRGGVELVRAADVRSSRRPSTDRRNDGA